MSDDSDFADSVADFNATTKAPLHVAMSPATVTFAADSEEGVLACSFGETENNGQLHETGQAIDNHRIGVLTIQRATYAPELLQTFLVVSAPKQPHLVGFRYQVSRLVANAGEPVIKAYCRRLET